MQRLTALSIFLIILIGLKTGQAKEKIQFNRDIRPLLSDNCFACHGPVDEQYPMTDGQLV